MSDPADSRRPLPRKSPRQARSTETVRVIVEAAARILEQKGLGGFTTNAVAERAGVSIGSLYQYFPSKDALMGALILRETSLLLDEAEAALSQPDENQALSALVRAAVRHQLKRPTLARLLDVEEARLPRDPQTRHVASKLQAILQDILCRDDLPRSIDMTIAAQDVLAIIKGMVDVAGDRGERDEESLIQRVLWGVLGYLREANTER